MLEGLEPVEHNVGRGRAQAGHQQVAEGGADAQVRLGSRGQKNKFWLLAKKSQGKQLKKTWNLRKVQIATKAQKTALKANF